MLQNGKPVQSLWLGGERFDKYSQDDEDALAKYKKLQAFIGTQVYVSAEDDITDIDIQLGLSIRHINPQHDGDVSVTNIKWDGDSSVDLIGPVPVYYYVNIGGSTSAQASTDLCIIGHESI